MGVAADAKLRVWSVPPRGTSPAFPDFVFDAVRHTDVSADGAAAAVTLSSRIEVFNTTHGYREAVYPDCTDVAASRIAPAGLRIAVVRHGNLHTIQLRDVKSGTILGVWQSAGQHSNLTPLGFLPDRRLVVAEDSGLIHVLAEQ